MRLILFLSVLCILEYSCRSGTKAPAVTAGQAQLVQTDSLSYTFHATDSLAEASIGFTYANRTADTMYIVNCNGAFSAALQVKKDSGWENFLFPPINECLSAPIVIPPGDVYKNTFFIRDILPGVRRDLDENAEYRIELMNVVRHYNTGRQQFGDPVPEKLRCSNAFRLSRE